MCHPFLQRTAVFLLQFLVSGLRAFQEILPELFAFGKGELIST